MNPVVKSYEVVGCIDRHDVIRCPNCCPLTYNHRELHQAIFGETETQCSEAVCEACHAALGNRVVHDGDNVLCGYCSGYPDGY